MSKEKITKLIFDPQHHCVRIREFESQIIENGITHDCRVLMQSIALQKAEEQGLKIIDETKGRNKNDNT